MISAGSPFDALPSDCGDAAHAGVDEVPEWRDWSHRESTFDQKAIEGFLCGMDLAGGAILHVGVGNSSLAAEFATRARLIDGITVQEGEVAKAHSLARGNYRVELLSKFDPALADRFGGPYDVIVDNNPSTFACCRKHFFTMMRSYAAMLREGGMLVTHRIGLGAVATGNDSRWSLDEMSWARIGGEFGLRPEPPFEDGVLILKKPARHAGPPGGDERVTAVVTSCGRPDLLERTLRSFITHNTFPVEQIIVVEDGPQRPPLPELGVQNLELIATGARVGQIAAIDYAYSRVTTPYVFHCEDDWEFYRSGFIERSLDVLRANSRCAQVWLRAVADTNGHPLEPVRYTNGEAVWQTMARRALRGLFHGFSFNPGLRRLADYRAVRGYGIHTMGIGGWSETLGNREAAIGRIYREKGMFAAILVDDGGRGYVRHIGGARHVDDRPLDALGAAP